MKRVIPFAAIMAMLILALGCRTQARVNRAFAEVLAEWRVDHPDAELTVEVEAQLRAAAEERAHGEVTKERQAAIAKASEAASKFTGGDLVGGGLGILALIGLGVGAVVKKKNGTPSVAEQIAADRAARAVPDAVPPSTTPPGGGEPAGA